MIQVAHSYGKLCALTTIPGYDDKVIRDPGIRIDRDDGDTYDTQEYQLEEQLAVKLEALKITWKDQGYNQEEIDILEEAFGLSNVTIKETKAEDRKRAKKLNKQANNSRKARLNAGS